MNIESTTTRTEEAVRRIVGLIREQKLTPDRRLPSERQLEEQWRLSRGTLNRAIACLIAQGHLRRVGYKLYPTGFVPGSDTAATPVTPPAPAIHLLQPPYSGTTSHGMLEGAHDVTRAHQTHTIPIISASAAEQCEQLGDLFRSGTNGFVLWPHPDFSVDNLLHQARAQNIPFVLCDLDLGPFDFVGVDNEQGMRLSVEHLHDLGHRRIVYVTQPLTISSLRRRCDGYIQGCMSRGMTRASRSVVEIQSHHDAHVAEAFKAYREQFATATAVAFSNDLLAIPFMRFAREAGIRVPEDLSVIGFDDVDFARVTTPGLTTIAQNFYRIGVAATQMLYYLIDNARKGRQIEPCHLRVEPRLVLRQSTTARK